MVKIIREGFTSLSGSEDARSDGFFLNIIFVHGLRGHPRDTWTGSREREGEAHDDFIRQRKDLKSFFGLRKAKTKPAETGEPKSPAPAEVFWPEEYLVPEIPKARIWSYGYNADVIGGFFQANNKNSISQHGRDLAVRIERAIENENPIVFVAHSLGGIIVKNALHRSKKCRNNTKFIVFLGTPHRGSRYASWGEIASNIAQLGLQDSNKRIVATLEVNGEVLDNIHEEFKSIVNEHDIKVHSFQEAHGISGIKGLDSKVVDDFSSKLDLHSGLETVESIDANHMEMARCRSKDDPRYRAIAGVLRNFVRKELLNKKTTTGKHFLRIPFLVPFSRDDSFIGREDILAMINVTDKQVSAPRHSRAALVGLGGVGKSQIAIEYIYRTRERMPEISVFWIHASTSARFEQTYRDIAEHVRLPGRDDPHVNILQLVCRWLSDEANGPWLMVLDNVDDDNVFFSLDNGVGEIMPQGKDVSRQQPLESFLPQSPNGSILVTSRSSTAARNLVGDFGNIIETEPMIDSEALALLKTRISFSESFTEDAGALVQELEGIPLAITHAAAYIRNRKRVTISVYLQLFRESEANQANLLNCNDAKDLRRDHSTSHPVIITWQITFEQIRRTTPVATDLMALMSMFDRQAIPECLLHDGTDRLQFEDAIAPLISFSLVRQQAKEGLLEMHRLVQLSTRKWLESNKTLQRWVGQALRTMTDGFPGGEYETWSLCQMLLPHSKEVLTFETVEEEDILNRAAISTNTGWYLVCRGEYAAGEMLLLDALKAREKTLGPEHLQTLESISCLATVLRNQGKYNEAESLNRRALKKYEKLLGPEHPNTLKNVSNLAVMLEAQGKYNEAESLNRRALKKRKNILGLEHPDTLTSVNNLASVLGNQRKYNEVESLIRRALKKYEKLLRSEHPNTLTSVSSLAVMLEAQGKYNEAESLNRRALKKRENILGLEHPDTLTSVNNLAQILVSQGKHDEAELLHRRGIKGFEKVLGSEHPETLLSMGNLAYTWKLQGRDAEAVELLKKCVRLQTRILGVDHPTTINSSQYLSEWQTQILEISALATETEQAVA